MPSHMPSSFASAAAGQSSNRDSRGAGRGEPRGSGDWNRKEPRSTNGTLTLRRSSTTPHNSSAQQSTSADQANSLPIQESQPSQPQTYASNILDSSSESRYTKEKLLEIYKNRPNQDDVNGDVSRLFVNNWDPSHQNGSGARGWGKSSDTRDHTYGPEICWDQSGQVQPIGLEEMTALERALFTNDVNSPLKPPPQSSGKDQSTPGSGANGRKTSISHGQSGSGGYGVTSPSSSRPGTRRRETSDSISYSSVASPGTGRGFNREESSFFSRKANEGKDEDRGEEGSGSTKSSLPFGGVIRSNTSGASLGNGPASPWGNAPTSATISPMGNFGSFSLSGGSNQPATPNEKKAGFGSIRGESRLAHLMPKGSSEDISAKASDSARPWRSRPRTDTDPFGDESIPSGSAALGGQDLSPPQGRQDSSFDTPARQIPSGFGLSDAPGFRDSQRFQSQEHEGEHEPSSPAETNPYASPQDERSHRDEHEGGSGDEPLPHMRSQALGGIPEHPPSNFGLPRALTGGGPFEGSDRSQTSSAGGSKGFPPLGLSGLGGLGGLGGWPTSANATGTPDRERAGFQGAFGNSLFGPMSGDLQSPSLSGLNGPFAPGPSGTLSGTNTIGRGSKLGSLFPAAMQAQMQNVESDNDSADQRQQGQFPTLGRNAFGQSRDTDSPLRSGRGVFDDLFPQGEQRNPGAFPSEPPQNAPPQQPPSFAQAAQAGPNSQQPQGSAETSGQVPSAQQRTMVMPDRMRWVYLDPQGNVQGPFSGLEMHDWYKAAFFTPDLSVKKVEDPEFEPLGQLIRRIGNSREPFLVPQIGVPHGPPTSQPPFGPGATNTQTGVVQPPFAGAFPSFGTTLTAEQQNNLERRKQEEQYLMARQREYLAQQQVNLKQMQIQGGIPSSLHHHSSAHSLQSQPSFGSITSPVGLPPQGTLSGGPPAPGVNPFFDNAAPRQAAGPGSIGPPPEFFRDEEIARLSLQERQQAFGAGGQQSQRQQAPQNFPPGDDAREAAALEQLRQEDPQGFKARLREFEQLRAQHEIEQGLQGNLTSDPIGPPQQRQPVSAFQENLHTQLEGELEHQETEPLSLTQQVKNAASAKQTPAPQPESPWGKVNTGLPMPFPPPQSTTPLPAPTAQRSRTNLPDALTMESRSRSETPETAGATPSVAPWAKESTEAAKGPSLKEIQEAEAKKAAKLEEAAVAARRAALEQEMRAQPVVAAPAPGLPTTSTWGSGTSPAVPAATPSAWTKAANTKVQSPSSASSASKKTLADIQKEEELRKQKAAAANIATAVPGAAATGKRYAELASKPSAPPATGAAWSTVGAGGKVKIPTGPASSVPNPAARSASTASVPTASSSKPVRPVAATIRSTTVGSGLTAQSGAGAAQVEFTKWAKGALAKGLNADINVDEFVQMLSEFPPEAGVIADSVYANSQLMDGRRFAEEFLRRKKLADKGIVETAAGAGFSTAGESKSAAAGGWNEVAKKGPPKEEPMSGFKVVPNKKKGKK